MKLKHCPQGIVKSLAIQPSILHFNTNEQYLVNCILFRNACINQVKSKMEFKKINEEKLKLIDVLKTRT